MAADPIWPDPIWQDDGWLAHNIWEHSRTVRELYAARARDEAEEMTCAAQAAELLAPLLRPGDSLLDAGCGSGYFFHSLRRRALPVAYHGFDASPSLIAIGQRELPAFGLPAERLRVLRLEDFQGRADHVLCMNLLSNLDNYHRPLERLLKAAGRSLILRESITDGARYAYVRDNFLDEGVDLKVHVNAYDRAEITAFVESYGFSVRQVTDRRTGGQPEDVIGYPHWWSFLVAVRTV
ncbi:class I SAM-dependent methyltransferase [Magnetospirillum sp. 15-1]|uniref:class I SAM-dependent methyltransferase n=1 Tax=Magnetospirillum sp. 15-1 TaxID=1979370 RepID=UPI000BBCAAD1|nr:class I SAM-dependent methyltransferase [Magnetospirillum sp. 15-1]